MKWYHWRQNNSGGHFDAPAIMVAVQSNNEEQARAIAAKLGVDDDAPFCPCCGERWALDYAHEADTLDTHLLEPGLYDYRARAKFEGIPVMLAVYADGRKEEFR